MVSPRGIFESVAVLIEAIDEYIVHNNENPKPFIWTNTAGEIIVKVRRGRVASRRSVNRALFDGRTTRH